MPSSLAETLEQELAVRGGVTLGMGPFLCMRYGESDLRKELNRRLQEAQEGPDLTAIHQILLTEISAGGLLPPRALGQCAAIGEIAPLLARAILERDPSGQLLSKIAGREGCSEPLKDIAGAFSQQGEMPNAEATRLMKSPLLDLFTPPRETGLSDQSTKKVGRNDPCPCGSGKKYKRCHEGQPMARADPDGSGTPGLTQAEGFPFRHEEVALSELCRARASAKGPRLGETLYWPIAVAPRDEIFLRMRLVGDNRADLMSVLQRGWELGCFETTSVTEALIETQGVNLLLSDGLNGFLEAMSPEIRASASFTGHASVDQLLELAGSDIGDVLDDAVRAASVGDDARAVDGLLACLVAGHPCRATAIARFLVLTFKGIDSPALNLLGLLEGALAASVGLEPYIELAASNNEGAQLQALQRTNQGLTERVQVLQKELAVERELRQRTEAAWSARMDQSEGNDSLRSELKRLRDALKEERETARTAIRDVQQFKRRERIRLLRESELEADVVAALVGEMLVEEEGDAPSSAREIRYLPEFEEAATRVNASTIERLRGQIEVFAQGQWTREAKRMEGTDGVWTLRAGLHYRALLRVRDDYIDVFDLIHREELDSVLARLRRN